MVKQQRLRILFNFIFILLFLIIHVLSAIIKAILEAVAEYSVFSTASFPHRCFYCFFASSAC